MEIDLGRILDAIPNMVWTMPSDGRIEYANRLLTDYTGEDPTTSPNLKWQDFLHPADLSSALERCQAIHASGEAGSMEARLRGSDGVWHRFLIQWTPLVGERGRVSKWCGTATNIDEFRVAFDDDHPELDFQLVVDSIPVQVAVTSPSGEVEGLNQPTLSYFGMSLADLKSWKASDVVHPDDLERTIAAQLAAHINGTPYNVDSRHRRVDGVYRWHNVLGLPLRNKSGEIQRWLHLIIDIEDRKRLEEQFAARERDLLKTINALPATAWSTRPDGYCDFLSDRWLDYAGFTFEEAEGWGWSKIIHPDDIEPLSQVWTACLATGDPVDVEARMRGRDGEYRWFLFRANPLRDENGTILKWYGTNIDIEDRKRAEEALKESERDARSIFNRIPALLATNGPNGENDGLNDQFRTYLGLSEHAAKNWRTDGIVHPDDLPMVISMVERSRETGEPSQFECRLRGADGIYRWFQRRSLPFRDITGNIVKWYSVCTDIHDRREAEEKMRESERQLRLILGTIPGLVVVFGPDGDTLGANDQTLAYVGQTFEEFRNWASNETAHPEDLPSAMSSFMTSLASGEPYEFEVRLRRYDGIYRWFQIRGRPARDTNGNITHWHALMTDIDDRKRVEDELRSKEAFLADAQRLSQTGHFSWLVGGSTIVFSEESYRIFETDPALPMTVELCRTRTHPDDIPTLQRVMQEAHIEGSRFDYQVRLVMPNGSIKYIRVVENTQRNENGELELRGAVQDITAIRVADEALARNERELSLIVHNMAGMIAIFKPDAQLDGCNQQLLDYFQMPLEEIANWATNGMTHPDDVQYCIDSFMGAIESGEHYDYETRFRRHDGVYRWFQLRGHPVRDEEGHIFRWYGLLTDIDDRKHAEDELRRSQTFLRTGQRISQTGIFSWQVDTDELMFSEELNRIFEFEDGCEITFEKIIERVHQDDLPILAEKMALVRDGFDNPEYEIRLRGRDGSTKYVRVIGQVIRHKDGRTECLGAIQEITERRLAEETRDQLRTELARVTGIMGLGQMAASIAHEVNQPLAGIVTNASTCLRMLAATPPNIDVALETARRTIRDGNRAADVIARVRALFSRRSVSFEAIDLNEAIQEVIALSSSELRRSGVVVHTELAKQLPFVAGDRVQVQQVIINLIRNAADAMSSVANRQKRLLISTYLDEEEQVRLSVHDNGVGFDFTETERIFEAFYTTKSDGMGIGLSVSRSIIESHNGRLWAKPNEGPGITVFFSLPQITEKDEFSVTTQDSHKENAEKAVRI